MKVTLRSAGSSGSFDVRIHATGARAEDSSLAGFATKDPSPEDLLAASLASCTATTMELYARRKGWELGHIEVDADYRPAQRGSPTRCTIVARLPAHVPPERRERLMQVGATSQVHRILEGEIVFEERVELMTTPKAGRSENGSVSPRRRIALLNGLRGARPRSRG